jgi:hypothetical protein
MVAAGRKDLEQYARFKDLILHYRTCKGQSGGRAFAIPMEFSARDKEFIELDRLSMQDFLTLHGFDSVPLHWYVNYACRDDYGTDYSGVSAWAGLHYFASRDAGEDEIDSSSVLTWPEGNGWLVKRLREQLSPHIHTGALVFHVDSKKNSAVAGVFDTKERQSARILAEHVILACPRQFAKYLLAGAVSEPWLQEFEYAPWLVANLTLNAFPVERSGTPLAWDNVIYDSASLGYVVATHQSLRTHIPQTVFTYYYPMSTGSAKQERIRLLETPWKAWADLILKDLAKPHPEIGRLVSHLDVFRWGHAMVRPRPGFIWGEARRQAAQSIGAVQFAHSDLSGFSIFEEAQFRGVLAAERVLQSLRIPFSSSIA